MLLELKNCETIKRNSNIEIKRSKTVKNTKVNERISMKYGNKYTKLNIFITIKRSQRWIEQYSFIREKQFI